MAHRLRVLAPAALATATALSAATQLPPASQQPASQQPPRQPSDINLIIGERIDTPPNFAVPDFLALSNDPDTVAAAKLIAEVLCLGTHRGVQVGLYRPHRLNLTFDSPLYDRRHFHRNRRRSLGR